MTAFTIFPAIDLRQGTVVRLQQGDPDRQTSFSDDPAAIARHWFQSGAAWLHLVNLDGAFGQPDSRNRAAIAAILEEAGRFGRQVQLGGGIRSYADIQAALNQGIQRVILGTLAVEQPDLLDKAVREFGAERIAAGVDAEAGMVKVRGWQQATRQTAFDLATRLASNGLAWLIFTDIARDGIGTGLNIASTQELTRIPGLKVIASGGVRDENDIERAQQAGCAGVIVGRALYDRKISPTTWEYC